MGTGVTIYEFEALTPAENDFSVVEGLHAIPASVFRWLEAQYLQTLDAGKTQWLRFAKRGSRRAMQVTGFVGVIRAPDGYQIEVLPKVGKAIGGGAIEARQLLIDMLCCLRGFRHVQTDTAKLLAARMPLMEIFIAEFLRCVEYIVKQGLRCDYLGRQGNVFALRGKLMIAQHLRHNVTRADRFYTDHDEFSLNRHENRLLHSALYRASLFAASQHNQQLARELRFVFSEVPLSVDISADFQKARLDRGMEHYVDALAWARLILEDKAPLTGAGDHSAPSLLFPMEAVFEAFVAKNLVRQVTRPLLVKTQASGHHLVRHREQNWFRMKPDILIRDTENDLLVLDTKWKLLDSLKANGTDKYGLSQADFYQLQAYGHSYLNGKGDVALIYPRTVAFDTPLPVFEFPKSQGLRLWVLPFCLQSRTLSVPVEAPFAHLMMRGERAASRPQ
jgi:5-methylcytosine-specific restriction enzyme subunit McrC